MPLRIRLVLILVLFVAVALAAIESITYSTIQSSLISTVDSQMQSSVSVWEQYASDVRGTALPTGHFLPEEAPDVVSAALHEFLT